MSPSSVGTPVATGKLLKTNALELSLPDRLNHSPGSTGATHSLEQTPLSETPSSPDPAQPTLPVMPRSRPARSDVTARALAAEAVTAAVNNGHVLSSTAPTASVKAREVRSGDLEQTTAGECAEAVPPS